MTPNGVQMLAAVNGRGAYAENGPKKQRKKARRKAAKARSYSLKARRKGISATKRAKYRRKAAKATRKSAKRKKKADYQKYVKRLANKAGLTRKQLIQLLRGEGMSKKEAEATAKCATGSGSACTTKAGKDEGYAGRSVGGSVTSLEVARNILEQYSKNGGKAEIFFSNRKKGSGMARKTRRKAGRKAARRGHRKAARRRSHRRSRSSSRRRSSGRRRSSKRSRKAGRRSSGRSRSSRRRFRRNGEDEFEMNGFEMNPYDGFEANAKKRGKGKKRRSSGGGDKKFSKLFAQSFGMPAGLSGKSAMGTIMLDRLAEQAMSGKISADAYKQLRRQIAKSMYPKQTGKGATIPVRVTDPISGKSKVLSVPWKGKVHTAFGPFERKRKGKGLTYLVKGGSKGEKIPDWAILGAYSDMDNRAMASLDPEWAADASARAMRIASVRERVRDEEMRELEEKIRRLESRKGSVSDPMTPNKRGSRGRRRGKRRMSAAQKKALVARLQRGRRAAAKRKGRKSGRKGSSRRKGRKKSRRSSRKGYSKNGRRRSSRRRSHRGRRRSSRRRSHRRSRRGRGRRKGRRGFRRNYGFGEISMVEALVGASVGAVGVYLLQKYLSPKIVEASPSLLTYTPAIVGVLGALATTFLGNKFLESKRDFVNASALSMLAFGGGLTITQMLPQWGLNGIPYVNTSGWGSRRPVGAYELRGTGAYELRGAGGMGAYELRGAGGLGAYPQQALAGGQYAQALAAYPQQALAGAQYAQALAAYEMRGVGQQPMDQELLPSHADAALDWADQSTAGEYVNSQLQPTAPLFFQDSLANLGVPSDSGGGIPSRSIWDPTGESFVDPSANVGGIFDDPNV